jgi:hypothetical protein
MPNYKEYTVTQAEKAFHFGIWCQEEIEEYIDLWNKR